MDAQLSAQLQKKVMEQSSGMAMNVELGKKCTLFCDPFAQIRANTFFFKKIWISQILASIDVQLPAKLQKK